MEKPGMELEKKDLIPVNSITSEGGNHKETKNDRHKWIASLEYIFEYILKNEESEQATRLIEELTERLRESGLKIPHTVSTPYVNTIPPEKEPRYPGDREIERRIKSLHPLERHGDGGEREPPAQRHRRPYLDVRFVRDAVRSRLQPFFPRRATDKFTATWFIFRATPRPAYYARAFLEGRLDAAASATISARNWPKAAVSPPIRIRI